MVRSDEPQDLSAFALHAVRQRAVLVQDGHAREVQALLAFRVDDAEVMAFSTSSGLISG